MRPPRRDSRASRHSGVCPEEAAGRPGDGLNQAPEGASHQDDHWDDPGSLVEGFFRECRDAADAPETILLAWLAILPPATEPPVAARSLLGRLVPVAAHALSIRQRRLLDLLVFIARHHRQSPEVADGSNTFED